MRALLLLLATSALTCSCDPSDVGVCGGRCPPCPEGTICFANQFVPECLRPCRDNRDCTGGKVCLTGYLGGDSGFCGVSNQVGPGEQHPAFCHEPPCSPPPSQRSPGCVDADRLATFDPAYCGRAIMFCAHGCETVPPDGGIRDPSFNPDVGRCRAP